MSAENVSLSAFDARARWQVALEKAWTRGIAESSPLALILVSFDRAETPEGADILQRALRVHCARTNDLALRRTSDQFAALLPDTSPAGARLIGERLVEAMRLEDADRAHRVSVGVAVTVPDENRAPDDLLRRAESALQAARDNGGDRCAGGSAAATAPPAPPKGPLAHLRNLLPGRKTDSDFKRRTD